MAEHAGSDLIEIGTPSKPTLKLLEDNAVEVKWITPKVSGTCIQEFEIAYKESSKKHHRTVNKTAGENKTVITRLKQNTKYEFILRALNYEDDKSSEWSEKTEILIDRNAGYNLSSSDEEEYYELEAESKERDDEKDAFSFEGFKASVPISDEILYDRKRNSHQKESAEADVEKAPIASNNKDDFSVNDAVPGVPICIKKNGSHSLTLVWQKPSAYRNHIDCYELFCIEGALKPKPILTDDANHIYKVRNLKQNCKYKFRVCAVTKTDFKNESSKLSAESEPITTKVSAASHLIKDDSTVTKKTDEDTGMLLYKLKCFEVGQRDTGDRIRQVTVGRGRDVGDGIDKRYVLLYGKVGSGKSTIIDLIVNHVYDVGFEDHFRLTAIDKMPDEMDRDESMSQTQWITCYELKRKQDSMLEYDLVLIDTPGFDSDSIETRERTRKQFRALFSSGRIPGLHAICFVNQSNPGRLTGAEHLLSETLVELVGQGIQMNIFIFATCADSTDPIIERLLREIRFEYHKCFKFNNSPFTSERQLSRSNDQQNDWEKGGSEILKFFNILHDLQFIPSEDFRVKAEACEKIRIEYYAKRKQITDACYCLMNLTNNNVIYEKIKVQSEDETYATICNKCKKTCCTPCLASWIHKRICWKIYFFSGKCGACPISCQLSDHEYGTFTYIQAPKIVSKQQETYRLDKRNLERKGTEIRNKGLYLLELLTEATNLQNAWHKETQLGVPFSDEDMIESFMNEISSTQSFHSELFMAIFEKCKKEQRRPEEDRWKCLDDLLNYTFSSVS